LEHKIPLSKGGTNEYNNLAIAHSRCNKRKFNKTEKEYKEEMKNGKR
jgi:5-methylcytosine-specific restriction endonuclease McrA